MKKIIFLSVLLIILILLLAGIFWLLIGEKNQNFQLPATRSEQDKKNEELVKVLSSNLVSSIIAYGKIKDVYQGKITLSYGSDNLVVSTNKNTAIYITKPPITDKKGNILNPNPEVKKIEDIKNGDDASISFRLMPDGTFLAQSVTVFADSAASK